MNKLTSQIGDLIKDFHEKLNSFLPDLETEVNQLINSESKNCSEIENYLDALLSLCQHDIGNSIFIKLLEYYKTVDMDGAKFYWEEYDGLED